jgi:hypothetical protein
MSEIYLLINKTTKEIINTIELDIANVTETYMRHEDNGSKYPFKMVNGKPVISSSLYLLEDDKELQAFNGQEIGMVYDSEFIKPIEEIMA